MRLKIFGESDPKSADALNQLIMVCQQGQPDNSPLHWNTRHDGKHSLSARLVDLSETSLSGIVFKVNKPGSKTNPPVGASTFSCLLAVFGGSNRGSPALAQLRPQKRRSFA